MKPSQYVRGTVLTLAVVLLSACGSSGSDAEEEVLISAAWRCAITVPDRVFVLPPQPPANCESAPVSGASLQTDQRNIHLSGSSFEPESDNCSAHIDPFVLCLPFVPGSYTVSWINETTNASGTASRGYGNIGTGFANVVNWNTYNATAVTLQSADPKGIALQMGANTIRVTATNLGARGEAVVTINRVVDVTPPTVHSVVPKDGATDASSIRVEILFSEQIDPASVVTALSVVDDNAQAVSGTSEYDPLKLKLTWRPDAPLSPATTHTATLDGITDLAPNVMLDPYQWSFTTRP